MSAAAAASIGLGKKRDNQEGSNLAGSALGQLGARVLENNQNTVGASGSDPFNRSNPMSPTPNILLPKPAMSNCDNASLPVPP